MMHRMHMYDAWLDTHGVAGNGVLRPPWFSEPYEYYGKDYTYRSVAHATFCYRVIQR